MSTHACGGETLTFQGDDDVWVFINKELAIDLGGVLGVANGTVNLDDFGLNVGQIYPLDVFHAERHTSQSNFRIDTDAPKSNTPARRTARLGVVDHLPPLTTVRAGAGHLCGLDQGGEVWCGGNNGSGELGREATHNLSTSRP